MTEREEWLKKALEWESPKRRGFPVKSSSRKIWVSRSGKLGLCDMDEFPISKAINNRMLARIDDERVHKFGNNFTSHGCTAYIFAFTRTGARQRAAFCRKQARLCKEKRKCSK